MPAAKPQDIRNIVFLGHGGCGKTTLGEAILFANKITNRLGSVDDGSSILDYSEIEKDRKHTIDPAMVTVEHDGTTINIIDAPGYPDFIGGAIGPAITVGELEEGIVADPHMDGDRDIESVSSRQDTDRALRKMLFFDGAANRLS